MDGTTLCPHCKTRFKIALTQLQAHQGLVRCGHCLQAFDARLEYIPDTPHPQMELAILDDKIEPSDAPEVSQPEQLHTVEKQVEVETEVEAEAEVKTEVETEVETKTLVAEQDADDLDFRDYIPNTSAQQTFDLSADNDEPHPPKRGWLWSTLSVLSVLLLLAQIAYFFRADIAARAPDTKPALLAYCKVLACTVPLPQKSDLMSIESSSLEADANNATTISLNALLRNHATYTLAFPNLELTLNDAQDKPVARRIFVPTEYLPPLESEQFGLQANHELNLKLQLDTTDLTPSGYRLVLFYPPAH